MAKMRVLLAICLALVLAVVLGSSPVSWAEGPGGYNVNTGPTDGGDGHPWDDGTTEQTDPGDDDNDVNDLEDAQTCIPGSQPIITTDQGFIGLTQNVLMSLWRKIRVAEISQMKATKTEVKQSPTKPRSVR